MHHYKNNTFSTVANPVCISFFFRRRQHLSTHFKVKGDITLLVYEGRLHIIKMQNAEDNGCHGFSSRWLVHFGPCKSYEVFLPRWIISISWHLSGPSVQLIDCWTPDAIGNHSMVYNRIISQRCLVCQFWLYRGEHCDMVRKLYVHNKRRLKGFPGEIFAVTIWSRKIIQNSMHYNSELQTCQVVLFCHDRDSFSALKAV